MKQKAKLGVVPDRWVGGRLLCKRFEITPQIFQGRLHPVVGRTHSDLAYVQSVGTIQPLRLSEAVANQFANHLQAKSGERDGMWVRERRGRRQMEDRMKE